MGKAASAVVSPPVNAMRVEAIEAPSAVSAMMSAVTPGSVVERTTATRAPSAEESADVMAKAFFGRFMRTSVAALPASAREKAAALSWSNPSVAQTMRPGLSGVALSCSSAALRSGSHAAGRALRSSWRADSASSASEGSRATSRGAVNITWIAPPPSCEASSTAAVAVRMISRQRSALVQPSSTTMSVPPMVLTCAFGAQVGRAKPRMASASAIMRRSSSHHGVRAGVSSSGFSSSSSASEGSAKRLGSGGVARSSSQSSGNAIRPSSAQGCRKRNGPRLKRRPRSARSRRPACRAACVLLRW